MNAIKLLRGAKNRIFRSSRPSLNDLDRKLEKYLPFRGGLFIEAGANDGYSQSNTYFLETKRGWKGVLVEGIPELYEKCKELRKKSIVYNCALVSDEFEHHSIEMHFANLMSVVEGSLKTKEDQSRHIQAGVDVQELDASYSVTVPARTLASILDEIPDLPGIDFFSLDVEGYELDVLKGMNLSKYRPALILVEARFFEEVNGFLEAKNYVMMEKLSLHDFLYKAQELL